MDQLRPPLPQRLRPAHWVGIDCAVTAVMALAYALIFRETADLRGIPYWASPAVVAVTVLPVAFRRYWPRTVLALVVAGGAVATAVSRNPDLPPLAVAFVMYRGLVVAREVLSASYARSEDQQAIRHVLAASNWRMACLTRSNTEGEVVRAGVALHGLLELA